MAIPRLVRDVGREMGKKINLTLEGGEVEMDREMVEMVVDPLTHIVRNAIDHGIEAPAERLAAGNPDIGYLRFAARPSGNQIANVITDDARGIYPDRLGEKAIVAKVDTKANRTGRLEEGHVNLKFSPGLY